MDKTIRYHPLFECDVREAAGWYNKRSPGLGDAFVSLVHECVEKVIEQPKRFGFSLAGTRYIRVPRFPYVVLFDAEDEEEIRILAVLHAARSMQKWRERQDNS